MAKYQIMQNTPIVIKADNAENAIRNFANKLVLDVATNDAFTQFSVHPDGTMSSGAMMIPCKPGDKLGYITESCGKWTLVEDAIREIRVSSRGILIGQTNHFSSIYAHEVGTNTQTIKALSGAILVREIFFLDDETRTKAETWINHMNTAKEN